MRERYHNLVISFFLNKKKEGSSSFNNTSYLSCSNNLYLPNFSAVQPSKTTNDNL